MSGRRPAFRVVEVTDGRRCVVEVRLPKGPLVLTRTVPDGTKRQHQVHLRWPLSPLWGVLLGRGFRRQPGPTVDALVRYAVQQP